MNRHLASILGYIAKVIDISLPKTTQNLAQIVISDNILGPMREVSLVGKTGEEAGANFSEYNRLLETKIPLLQHILPWGAMSVVKDPKQSDDGPIWWVRPGEQR